ncbi:MAG: hypothetical protein GX032_00870 [Tenericutes bacterium]|nr:hypothetical protein [Bacilli bacterium]MDD4831693.1 hypothetical protein [Bacilli bacterium]NLV90013.1 hypothetical protein [Mycoplasmatota bacterium]
MREEKLLVFEVETKSGSDYSVYKYDDMCVLKSSSKAFNGADFVVINNLYIDEKLNFNGKVYFNAQFELYEKKYRIIPRNKLKKVLTSNLDSVQKTTKIKELDLKNKKEFNNLVDDKIISIDEKYLEEYDLD